MAKITPVEYKVLNLILREKSNSEIAAKLAISLSGAERIKTNLYRKTKTKTGIGLLKWAIRNKLYKV